MSKVLTTTATIMVLGLAATGVADARGGGGFGGGGHSGFGGGHIGAMGGAHIGGFGGGHIGGFGGAHLGGMRGAHIGGMGHVGHLGGLGGPYIGSAGAAHMGRLGAGHVGAMGGTVGGHDPVTGDFARHDRRFYGDWDYAASCAIYEPYYRPWCAGDADSGILSPNAVY
jgi:hypothetical protein